MEAHELFSELLVKLNRNAVEKVNQNIKLIMFT